MKIALIVNRTSVFLSHREDLFKHLSLRHDVDIYCSRDSVSKYDVRPLWTVLFRFWSYDRFIVSTPLAMWFCVLIAPFVGRRTILLVTGMGSLWESSHLVTVIYKVILLCWVRSGANFLVQNSEDHGIIAGLGCEPSIFFGSGVAWCKRKELFREAGTRKFVFAGRIYRDKGILELVRAARLADLSMEQIVLVGNVDVTNPNTYTSEELNEIFDSGVSLYPRMSNSEFITFMESECDIAVLPSYREGMSKFLLEAISLGMPILTAATPGGEDLIREAFANEVDLNDLEQFASQLDTYNCMDPEELVRIGDNNRERGRAFFSNGEYFRVITELL